MIPLRPVDPDLCIILKKKKTEQKSCGNSKHLCNDSFIINIHVHRINHTFINPVFTFFNLININDSLIHFIMLLPFSTRPKCFIIKKKKTYCTKSNPIINTCCKIFFLELHFLLYSFVFSKNYIRYE